jgi:hypothetical protein
MCPRGELPVVLQLEWVIAAQIGDKPVKADVDAGGTFAAIPRRRSRTIVGPSVTSSSWAAWRAIAAKSVGRHQ